MQYYVIGAGSIGKRHHDNLIKLGATVTLLGWRGLDLPELGAKLSAGPSAMIIATATDVRLELIELAAKCDTPIYLEKPVAVSRSDLDRVFELTQDIAHRSIVGFMMRYHPLVKRLLNDDLSDIYDFTFEIGHDVHQWRPNWNFDDSYAARPESGGALLDLCHEIDLATLAFPGTSLGTVRSLGHEDYPNVDFASEVQFSGPKRAQGTVKMDYLAPTGFRNISLKGTNQVREINLLTLTDTDHVTGDKQPAPEGFDRNDMFLGIMTDFMTLAEGMNRPLNARVPKLDLVKATCETISNAWESREFTRYLERKK